MGGSKLMRGPFAALVGLALTVACTPDPAPVQPAAPAPSAATPGATPSPLPTRPAAAYTLTATQAGLRLLSSRDHVGYVQAASEERNQAAALELYRTFDWVERSERVFGTASHGLDEKVLVALRTAGARNAFSYYGALAVVPPLVATPCPPETGLDQCAEGRAGSTTAVAGRRGVVVFYLVSTGVAIDGPLRAQAALVSGGSPA